MKIVFLPSTIADLRWFKNYYMTVFPAGKQRAERQFQNIQNVLKANPYVGHPSDGIDGAREHKVLRTPFTFLYRVKEDRIEILRVMDDRAGHI